MNDIENARELQSRRYFDLGWCHELGIASFEDYIATIPEIPTSLIEHDELFPLLVLVDPRLGLSKTCRYVGMTFDYPDDEFVPIDVRHETPLTPYWTRVNYGLRNGGGTAIDCRNACSGNELCMTAMVGVCMTLHEPHLVCFGSRDIVLPGSRYLTENRVPTLGIPTGRIWVELFWTRADNRGWTTWTHFGTFRME